MGSAREPEGLLGLGLGSVGELEGLLGLGSGSVGELEGLLGLGSGSVEELEGTLTLGLGLGVPKQLVAARQTNKSGASRRGGVFMTGHCR